jgi:hypothetical protein
MVAATFTAEARRRTMPDNGDELNGGAQEEEITESDPDDENDAILNEKGSESPRDNI